ncbi:MAG: magnesium and cobalt transport protein CorA, partial [Chlorobiales bacterium]|nr:magnesium and cobalt transport protein CorA [Chlorobiales bacterium]
MKKDLLPDPVQPQDHDRTDIGGKVLKRRSKTAGKPPGTLIHIGEKRLEKPVITMIAYSDEQTVVRTLSDLRECLPFRESHKVVWINIDGLHDVTLIARAGEVFGIESLTLEDILHTGQRAKVEDFDRYVYMVLQMLEYSGDDASITREQLSIILTDGVVITFQEMPGDMFDAVRQRIA